jgi:predicted TIM-barrel fold metal-dependent hydrolase
MHSDAQMPATSVPPYGIVDAWVNPSLAGVADTPFLTDVTDRYFRRDRREVFTDRPAADLVTAMDAAAIERAVITIDAHAPEHYRDIFRTYPERFIASVVIDPLQGMDAVRLLERVVRDHGVRLVRLVPFLFNRPPNDKVCYPIYAKCIELGIPVSVTTGIPGPPMPAEPQRPLYLDEVCLFYPDLVLIMAHGADPWWGEAIRLLLKYPNLYMMTSAYAPKYLPSELLHFMRTRGKTKVMFATDYPFLPFDRCVREARGLPLPEDVRRNYLRDNALRVFRWGPTPARANDKKG